jgi:hypothetical protein
MSLIPITKRKKPQEIRVRIMTVISTTTMSLVATPDTVLAAA